MYRVLIVTVLSLGGLLAKQYLGDQSFQHTSLDKVSIVGALTLNSVVAKDLSILGPFQFDEITADKVTVTGPIKSSKKGKFSVLDVTGPVEMDGASVEVLRVIGPSILTHVVVTGEASLIGPLTAKYFNAKRLEITATDATFEDSKIEKIVVKKSKKQRNEVITLSGNSRVTSISFESAAGVVKVLDAGVELGSVSGGVVERGR